MDFAIVVLYLLMFNVCGIIGIPKIEFFNFSGTERVKKFHRLIQWTKLKYLYKPTNQF